MWLIAQPISPSVSGRGRGNRLFRNDLTIDAGLRYDRQTLTDATANFAPRVGFGWHPNGDAKLAIRGGYGMYYTQIRANAIASALTGGLDGITTYQAKNVIIATGSVPIELPFLKFDEERILSNLGALKIPEMTTDEGLDIIRLLLGVSLTVYPMAPLLDACRGWRFWIGRIGQCSRSDQPHRHVSDGRCS